MSLGQTDRFVRRTQRFHPASPWGTPLPKVETDYNLQVFSGQFHPNSNPAITDNTITDFNDDGTPFVNVSHAGTGYNMGGCMGCHGNAQQGGADFSFILKFGRVSGPDTVPGGSSGSGAKAPAGQGGTGSRRTQK